MAYHRHASPRHRKVDFSFENLFPMTFFLCLPFMLQAMKPALISHTHFKVMWSMSVLIFFKWRSCKLSWKMKKFRSQHSSSTVTCSMADPSSIYAIISTAQFRKFQILTLASLYIFEMLCFLKNHQGHVKQNLEIHGHNARKKYDLHTRHCSTILYQKSVTNMGMKLFNKLPIQIKQLNDYKGFKREVKIFSYAIHFTQLKNFCTLRDFSIVLCTFYLICY